MDRDEQRKESEKLIAEFLAKGGQIKKIPMGQKTEIAEVKNQWGKPRKKVVKPE